MKTKKKKVLIDVNSVVPYYVTGRFIFSMFLEDC